MKITEKLKITRKLLIALGLLIELHQLQHRKGMEELRISVRASYLLVKGQSFLEEILRSPKLTLAARNLRLSAEKLRDLQRILLGFYRQINGARDVLLGLAVALQNQLDICERP